MIPFRNSYKVVFTAGSLFVTTALAAVACSVALSPRPAISAVLQETSALTGITMPRGGARFQGADSLFSGVLTSLAKEKVLSLTPAADSVEVFIWRGDSYNPEKVPFTKSSLKRALTGAGFNVTEVSSNDIRDTNVFAHYDREATNLAFRPALTKRINFFRAVHEAKGQTLLGVWLEDENALAVGLMPMQFKAAKKPAPLPEVTGSDAVLVKDPHHTMKGLPPARLPVFETIHPKPGTVRGQVKDGAGRPIAGARIAVFSSVGGGFRTTHKAISNARGIYEVLLPTGVAEVAEAKCSVHYNGVTYELPLLPVGEAMKQFTSRSGHVANFVLRSEGDFGGTIRVLDNVNQGTLEVTIAPVGRLLDGSAGRTFIYRFSASESSETFLNGIPLGRYRLTARLLEDGEANPMQVQRTFGSEAERELKESLIVDFEPGYTFSQVNFGKSNKDIQIFQVTLEP